MRPAPPDVTSAPPSSAATCSATEAHTVAEIDERFLAPDPRIARWFATERQQCRGCASVRPDHHMGMRCNQVPLMVPHPNGGDDPIPLRGLKAFCIDARELDGPCGPDARLFQLS